MNVLIDTNVLLSAALRNRLPEAVVTFIATNERCRWIVTESILREYVEVIRRPKFGFADDVLVEWSNLLTMRTIQVPEPDVEADFPRDPKDAIFLSVAVASQADFLVTGDNDLLQSRQSIAIPTRIVTVAEFAQEFDIV